MIEQEKKTRLLKKIKKLEAYHEIQNEMGRATAAFNFREKEKVLSYFALNMDDVSFEYADEGLFEGKAAVEEIIDRLIGKPAKPGEMLDMQLTTPMIEIADDLKTAKCIWWCPGAGAIRRDEEEPQAIWAWGQIAVDFIQVNDMWKIWHFHYFRLIKCSYEQGWVKDTSMINRMNLPVSSRAKPTTYHNPYSPLSIREGIPSMPLAYTTYTKEDRFWELNKDKQ